MPKLIDLVGKRFGRLVVIKRVENDKWRASCWLCQCDCKNEIIVRGASLKGGNTKSCGCLVTKHGHTKNGKYSNIYQSWNQMIQRCTNPNNKEYFNYGGRGITVCEEWLEFKNFNDDMMKGWKPGLTIERINKNGNYNPENCKWATRKEQARNRRNNLYLTYNNKTRLLIEWSKETGISYTTLWIRIYKLSWSIKKTLTTSVLKYKRKING